MISNHINYLSLSILFSVQLLKISLVFARKDKGLVVCGHGILIAIYPFVKKSMIKRNA